MPMSPGNQGHIPIAISMYLLDSMYKATQIINLKTKKLNFEGITFKRLSIQTVVRWDPLETDKSYF